MTPHADDYTKLLNELVITREIYGGELSESVESLYVERLDEIWHEMSDEEQKLCEIELKSTPKCENFLGLVDCVVDVGSSSPPRMTV